jgi:hypothetical protein
MNKKTASQTMDDILDNALGLTGEERYKKHFSRNLWSVQDFAALMVGMLPSRFSELDVSGKLPKEQKEKQRYCKAKELMSRFVEDKKYEGTRDVCFIEEKMYLPPWKFIKWVASNRILIIKIFCIALPLYLIELYEEFQPMNEALRKAHFHTTEYHKAKIQDCALELIEKAFPKKPHLKELYRHPKMEYLLSSFINPRTRKRYNYRTICHFWIKEVYPDSPRGRPAKRPK